MSSFEEKITLYQKNLLENKEALDYLNSRGYPCYKGSILEKVKVGFYKKTHKGDPYNDMIMFPGLKHEIPALDNKTFVGRSIKPNANPKSMIESLRKPLVGILGENKDLPLFLVEGPFDAMSVCEFMNQENVVACLGTNIAEDNLFLLSSAGYKQLNIFFDSDMPGKKGTRSVFRQAIKYFEKIRVLETRSEDCDPDKYARHIGDCTKFHSLTEKEYLSTQSPQWVVDTIMDVSPHLFSPCNLKNTQCLEIKEVFNKKLKQSIVEILPKKEKNGKTGF